MLLDLPYAERQQIVVVDDHVAEAQLRAEQWVEEKKLVTKQGVDWSEVGMLALRAVLGGPATALTKVAIDVIKAQYQLRNHGIKVLPIGRREASKLRFPPGHPRDRVLYIGHPGIPSIYYTIAQFHRLTFEHKFAEAIRLTMALGATELAVEHVSGWKSEFSAKLSVPIPHVAGEIGASAAATQGSGSHLLFKAELRGTDKPAIPNDLVWYPHEPMWQELAQARIQFGLKNFSLKVQYEDDFGVNAGLKVKVKDTGLDLGGNFEGYQSTVWDITAKFDMP